MNWEYIETITDIKEYSLERGCILLSNSRRKLHITTLIKGIIKQKDKIYFRLVENEILPSKKFGNRIYRLLCLHKSGQIEIVNNYATEEELKTIFNNIKQNENKD